MKEILLPASVRPLRAIDSVADLRVVEAGGDRTRLFRIVARTVELFTKFGVRFHAKDS